MTIQIDIAVVPNNDGNVIWEMSVEVSQLTEGRS